MLDLAQNRPANLDFTKFDLHVIAITTRRLLKLQIGRFYPNMRVVIEELGPVPSILGCIRALSAPL